MTLYLRLGLDYFLPRFLQSVVLQSFRLVTKLRKINPLNTEFNPIRHFLTLVGARHIVHVSRVRVKDVPAILPLLHVCMVCKGAALQFTFYPLITLSVDAELLTTSLNKFISNIQ